jgi:hypothetical protein
MNPELNHAIAVLKVRLSRSRLDREQAERDIVNANSAHQERVAGFQAELADAKVLIASFQAALKALGCKEEDEAQ